MKRVLFVLTCDKRTISTFPAVCNCANELKQRGFYVKIITGVANDTGKKFFDEYIRIKINNKFVLNLKYLYNIIRKQSEDYIFAFEPMDAIYTALTTIFNEKKYFYYNLEIFDDSGVDGLFSRIRFNVLKQLEKIFLKKCSAFIIQDRIRENISNLFGIKLLNTYYIPNSYYSTCDIGDISLRNGIVFHGGLEKWAIELMIENIRFLNKIDLSLAGWSNDGYLDTIRDKLQENCISIKQHMLSNTELENFIKNYKIGLVIYTSKAPNVHYIGRSSGKFFLYLKYAIPVIVLDLPGISEDVKKYNLGIVIKSIQEIPEAVKIIEDNYIYYVENIKKVYTRVFDYKIASKDFFDSIV